MFEFLEIKYGKIRILQEERMGSARADAVMVRPQELVGIEIKSDADTYARLARQIREYDRYYDRNILVVGTGHTRREGDYVEDHVPEHWGVITVELEDGAPNFYIAREPRPNPHVEQKKKISILLRPELAHIQQLNAMHRYERLSKEKVIDKILEQVPEEILQMQMCEELFQRDYEKIRETINAYRTAHGKKARTRRRQKYRPV